MTIKYNSVSNFITFLLLVTVIGNASLIPMPSIIFQLLLYGTLVLVVTLFSKNFNLNLRMLFVIVAAIVSLILSNADARYDTTNRFLTWLLLISAIGPLFYSPSLIKFRNKLFDVFMITFMIIGGLCFIYYVLGLPHLGRGHFTGIMKHSMILAPVASMGGLYAFYRFMKEPKGKIKLLFLTLFIVNTIDVILAASRAAFVGMMAGVLVYFVLNKFRFRKIILVFLIMFTIGVVIKIETIQQDSSSQDSLFSRNMDNTREGLWADRIQEFKHYPYFGVGFATQEDSLLKNKKGSETGVIEPGSTYLMILSMTGLFGAFTMIVLLIKPLLSKSFWRRIVLEESYKAAIFVFFFIHFIAEGYLFSSGSIMAFIFWLLLGATYPYVGINYSKLWGNS